MAITNLASQTSIDFKPFVPESFPYAHHESELVSARQSILVRRWQEFMRDQPPYRDDQSDGHFEDVYIIPYISHITGIRAGLWRGDVDRAASLATSMIQWFGTQDGYFYLTESMEMHDMACAGIKELAPKVDAIREHGKEENRLRVLYDMQRNAFLWKWHERSALGQNAFVPLSNTSIRTGDRIFLDQNLVLRIPEFISIETKHIDQISGLLKEIPVVSETDALILHNTAIWFGTTSNDGGDNGCAFLKGCLEEIALLGPKPRRMDYPAARPPKAGRPATPS